MQTREFDYAYPSELIADQPLARRSDSKMMVVCRKTRTVRDDYFSNFPSYFREGDLLVFNDTKVLPVRLIGQKPTGGKVEILLVKQVCAGQNLWECLVQPKGAIRVGSVISFPHSDSPCTAIFQGGEGKIKTLLFPQNFSVPHWIRANGLPPLPPYILKKRKEKLNPEDYARYQTLFARKEGSIAAPTAGLHFTLEILEELKARRVETCFATLHVGLGTFQPVRTENIEDHAMHEEAYEIPDESIEKIMRAKKEKRKITAIGTTSVRALESCFSGEVPKRGVQTTDIFIYPGYNFKMVDQLFTNFHQPESTLLMLVCALAGKEFVLRAYQEAIAKKYRLFSYGDAMLIL